MRTGKFLDYNKMKKILFFALLLSSFTMQAQVIAGTMPGSTGTLIGFLEHIAPANSFGNKDPWIIYLHGIDHRAAHPVSATDTARIRVIANKGVPKLVKDAPLPYYKKPGGGPTEYYRWNVIAPQADSDDGQWQADMIIQCINRIRTTYATTTDTSLIIIIGYSLGGGGVFSGLHFSTIRPYIKYAVSVSGGYINTPDYTTLSTEAINCDIFATVGDALASVTLSDTWVSGLKAQNPIQIPHFFRMADVSPTNSPTDHDKMVQIIVEDTTVGDTYPMANGDTWTRTENLYMRGLRFGGGRRMSFYPFIFITGIFFKRRKCTT